MCRTLLHSDMRQGGSRERGACLWRCSVPRTPRVGSWWHSCLPLAPHPMLKFEFKPQALQEQLSLKTLEARVASERLARMVEASNRLSVDLAAFAAGPVSKKGRREGKRGKKREKARRRPG